MRQCERVRSEKNVTNVISVLENEYLNPFSATLDPNELYNLSSGMKKEDGVEPLLNVWENGKVLADEFFSKRISSSEIKFHEPLQRVEVP